MKALITICFTIDGVDDDDLLAFANGIGDGMRRGMIDAKNTLPEGVTIEDVSEVVSYYGVTISLEQPLEVEEAL